MITNQAFLSSRPFSCSLSVSQCVHISATTLDRVDTWEEDRGGTGLCPDAPGREGGGEQGDPLRAGAHPRPARLREPWTVTLRRIAAPIPETKGGTLLVLGQNRHCVNIFIGMNTFIVHYYLLMQYAGTMTVLSYIRSIPSLVLSGQKYVIIVYGLVLWFLF